MSICKNCGCDPNRTPAEVALEQVTATLDMYEDLAELEMRDPKLHEWLIQMAFKYRNSFLGLATSKEIFDIARSLR